MGLAIAAGVTLDLGLRGGLANGLVATGVVLVVVGLVTDRRVAQRPARRLAWAALVPAAFLALRTSPWSVGLDVAALVILLSAALAFSRSGTLTDARPLAVLGRIADALPRGWSAPRSLRALVPKLDGAASERLRGLGRALLVAVPVLAVVVVLLASADAVFASFFHLDLDGGRLLGHLVLAGLCGLGALAVIGAAGAESSEAERTGPFGVVEVTTMLGLAVAVLGMFVVSQAVALTATGEQVIASSGQTPAEYARSGFFQLCWAIAVLLGFLALTRSLARPGIMAQRGVRALAAAVPLLALALVAVSLRRMALYDEAFGLTMLRLWVIGATLWFGVVLVLVALRNAGIAGGRDWMLAGAGAAALVLVVVANVTNPEAFVVRHNVDRARSGADLDLDYLATLSDDAVPALADAAASEGDPARRRQLLEAVGCGDDARGAAAVNIATQRARSVRQAACDGAG